jgi:hypothetical protein
LDRKLWKEYVDYYSQIPWQLFCTFTFPRRLRNGDDEARSLWSIFIEKLEASHPDTICRLVAEESRHAHGGLSDIRVHYHVLLTSDTPIDGATIRNLWRSLAGNGKKLVDIQKYDPEQGAVGYCLKLLDSPDGQVSSYNEDLYLPERPADWDRNGKSRRRFYRQMKRRDASLTAPSLS